MKLLFFVFVLFVSRLSVAQVELVQPPQLNKIEKEEFKNWKRHFLVATNVKNKQMLRQNALEKNAIKSLYLNELIFSQSPYLKQHAHNPVNWKPWSQKVLEEAKLSNKLIFLSIGYSTCHWCHVMEKESFNNFDVANLINKNYLAIKVDREELPNLDNYYAAALEQVKGSAGWPITVIINGDGLPVFIDSYLAKDKLMKLLSKINQAWHKRPDFLLSGAKNIDSLVHKTFELGKDVVAHKPNALELNQKILAKLDTRYGGFVGEVKFPEISLLLYMLDQIKRKPNKKLEIALKLQLDNMASGGLHDHIEGGFHRYSTDYRWKVPHYEKMLYTQAQLIDIYAKAYQYFFDKKYFEVVERTTNFMIEGFYVKGKGFSSAMDADYEGKEGGYYLWSRDELNAIERKIEDSSQEFFTTYSLLKNENDQETSKSERDVGVLLPFLSESASKEVTTKLRQELLASRKSRGKISIDNKVLTGWNGLAIKSLVSAGKLLKNNELVKIADSVAKQLWSERFQFSTQLFSRTGGSTNQNTSTEINQSHLEDYVYFAEACISLYDLSNEHHWLQKVQYIKNAIMKHFLDSDGGLYNVSNRNIGLSLKNAKDAELSAPSSVMFNILYKLNRRLGENKLAKVYPNIVNNMAKMITKNPLNHLYGSLVFNQMIQGSTSNLRFFASSKGQLSFSCENIFKEICLELEIKLKLADGWHINSNEPFEEHLMPTKILAPAGFNITYPNAKRVKLGFQKKPLSVYDGQFKIIISRKKGSAKKTFFELPLQACSDTVCLLPETIKFYM